MPDTLFENLSIGFLNIALLNLVPAWLLSFKFIKSQNWGFGLFKSRFDLLTKCFSDGEFVCEPDEYAKLVKEMKKAGLIKDHRVGLSSVKKSFKGQEFVDWLTGTKRLG